MFWLRFRCNFCYTHSKLLPLYRPVVIDNTQTIHAQCPHSHTHLFASILYNCVGLYSDFDISLKWSISNKHMWFVHRHRHTYMRVYACDWLLQRNSSHRKSLLLVVSSKIGLNSRDFWANQFPNVINEMHYGSDQFLIQKIIVYLFVALFLWLDMISFANYSSIFTQ